MTSRRRHSSPASSKEQDPTAALDPSQPSMDACAALTRLPMKQAAARKSASRREAVLTVLLQGAKGGTVLLVRRRLEKRR